MSVTASYQIQGLKLLDGKVAVIYGAAGGVGAAVAKAFAREGATVFLAGRTENSLNLIAKEISNSGGVADVSKVDGLAQNPSRRTYTELSPKQESSTFLSTSLGQASQWARS
jgi:NADP-dependent 3-hydroxy acid dehydrogenase YdfG